MSPNTETLAASHDAPPATPAAPAIVDAVDTRYLQTLLGYNARRAALTVIDEFVPRMAQFGLRVVDFSILSVIHHNPGITSRQLCAALALLPPTSSARSARWNHAACWRAGRTRRTAARSACT